MGLLGWWKGRSERAVDEWRTAWAAAIVSPDRSSVATLQQSLDALGLTADDREIEEEMLQGLSALCDLSSLLAAGQLPTVETGHRVVGTDLCHFSAPASAPDDPAQPAGRVILTGARAVFAGGGRTVSCAWHTVSHALHAERDLLLTGRDGERVHRFRFNSFADALCAAALARRLSKREPSAPGL